MRERHDLQGPSIVGQAEVAARKFAQEARVGIPRDVVEDQSLRSIFDHDLASAF